MVLTCTDFKHVSVNCRRVFLAFVSTARPTSPVVVLYVEDGKLVAAFVDIWLIFMALWPTLRYNFPANIERTEIGLIDLWIYGFIDFLMEWFLDNKTTFYHATTRNGGMSDYFVCAAGCVVCAFRRGTQSRKGE